MSLHLSHTCKAAIKSVAYLTSTGFDCKSSFSTIAEAIGESPHTVSKLLQTLVQKGIINSQKGPGGGFSISEKQAGKSISLIITAIDGDDKSCMLGITKCNAKKPCLLHKNFLESRRLFTQVISQTSILSLVVLPI